MIRKLILPAACAALLGGCMSYGYSDAGYGGYGGYYYGQPSVRYYGGASYGYPYSSYPYSRYYGGRYGYGYGGYYGYPYYPYYPRRPPHDHDHDHDDDHDDDKGGNKPPWRSIADDSGDILRRRHVVEGGPAPPRMSTPSQRQRVENDSLRRPVSPSPPRAQRPAPERRMSTPAPRNMRERDVRREQEP